jgi:hypothetical protein
VVVSEGLHASRLARSTRLARERERGFVCILIYLVPSDYDNDAYFSYQDK